MNDDALMAQDREYIWHPFTQMHDYAQRDLLLVDRAQGIKLYDRQGREYFDTISSWWCIVHGHSHPTMQRYVREQLEKLDQVLLAGISHEPAIRLAAKLVELTPPGLDKVFYSDNGSTACEVAVKMSLQYWQQSGHPERQGLLALERGYHGDTIGTMSLGGVPEFHQAFAHLMFPSHRLTPPTCYRCPAGMPAPLPPAVDGREQLRCDCECLQPLAELLAREGERLAAFILEPRLMAAGGMIIYPAQWLRRAAELTRSYGVHLIFDEVATGFGRTGTMFALESAGVTPDFLCLSKGLTGGMLPMAVTMTSDEIYRAFYGEYHENRTFFHGHTFSGNPLAAAAALGSLAVFEEEQTIAGLSPKMAHLDRCLARFKELPWVGDLRRLGMIAALELVADRAGKQPFPAVQRVGWPIYLAGLEQGLLLRPLGNIVYLWLPLSTTEEEITTITEKMWQVLSNPANIAQ
ncbi:adenosylmethionine--8-amino-7-oxononanoate transaminase [Desulfurivibrio dismutans]|uniref:adenosylmethionine--8-amino-7-oxononanoate transaminase n=1 Tax=Desulfurivibrio dismutans TaxID=1398908 RepID=UPI0023DCC333|nr:adenosylmethionine--8-amino-7-oxononanoate transaminase [Desulfurivibrio alkaliphilus]MDF1614251.1 adenosylmethionine--8-amino-7-oxononanoate transaminase [Desulfurivibrio alkaliphilus]